MAAPIDRKRPEEQAKPAPDRNNMPNLMPPRQPQAQAPQVPQAQQAPIRAPRRPQPSVGGMGLDSDMRRPQPDIGEILAAAGGTGEQMIEQKIGQREAQEALGTLERYRAGKQQFEARIIREEQWYKLQHGGEVAKGLPGDIPKPTTAWMLSTIMSKHADMMDACPIPAILPREQSDERSAKLLSEVVPVILERADFSRTYSENCWDKAKYGTACYGVFWDSSLENGLGDIAVKPIDLLNIFWEPGVRDIQDSRNLFIVSMVDNDTVDEMFPGETQRMRSALHLNTYRHEDEIDDHDKTAIIDWYYKRRTPEGKTLLHYAKLIGDHVLFASENDTQYAQTGWYEHGEYPVVFDILFPEKDTPTGFGYIAENMDTQLYIDKLSGYILDHMALSARQRYWMRTDGGVNEEEFLENNRLVHVSGSIDDDRLRAIDVPSMGSYPIEVLKMKIEEMKETSANRDFGNGGTASGVTAASAIYALQESGNKVSRDTNQQSYRAYSHIVRQIIELVRQFYDEPRVFRIVLPDGGEQFEALDNRQMREQVMGISPDGETLIRRPIYDIKVSAQKRNPFSNAAQNEQAMQLYGAGFFAPEQAQASLIALEMMEFEGKDKVIERVQQGQTLLNIVQQMQAQMQQMQAAMGLMPAPGAQQDLQPPKQQGKAPDKEGMAKEAAQAQDAPQAPPRTIQQMQKMKDMQNG